MIPSLSLTCAVFGSIAAIGVTVLAVRGRRLGRLTVVAVVVLELAAVLQAVRDAVGLLGGHQPAEPGTHWGYLITSVVVIPLAAMVGQGDRGRWGAIAIAVGLGAFVVVVFRMQQTWYPAATGG
jgi:hypothetical protein